MKPHTDPAGNLGATCVLPPRRRQRTGLLTPKECEAIAARYDGQTATLDALLAQYREHYPELKRHNITSAARRGGYQPARAAKRWTEAENDYLRCNWHLRSGDEIAAHLNRSFNSVNLQRKRLGIGRYDGEDLTIRDLESTTGLDHRQWHHFIEAGWLHARQRGRRNGAAPMTYVTIDAVLSLLRRHPEIIDYRTAPAATRALLELHKLPDPPKYKRVACHSDAWKDQMRATPTGRRVTHGAAELRDVPHHYSMLSCAEVGGTAFWAPTYSMPQCPRCGCTVSRYAPDAVYTDEDPSDDEVLDLLARKLGLRWESGGLVDADGQAVREADVLFYLFSSSRNPGRALTVFRKLLERGFTVNRCEPVTAAELAPNILNFELRAEQQAAFEHFLSTGSMTAAHAMSFGKSTLALMALTRMRGHHLLMTDRQLLQEQWLTKLLSAAPHVVIKRRYKPAHVLAIVYDHEGQERSRIDLYGYQTRAELKADYVLAVWDEVRRLPSRQAHRHALVRCRYRLGLDATPLREDGGESLIQRLTGNIVGGTSEEWEQQFAANRLRRPPVQVMIVRDLEHKHAVTVELTRQHRTLVMTESLADGEQIAWRAGIPFVHHATKDKLATLQSAHSACISRVGDSGLSLPQFEVTIDHSGLFGSRSQSLQRLGRLLHSTCARFHVILMTPAERERFAKRVDVIRQKGFEVEERVLPEPEATCSAHRRVSAARNPFLSILGWASEENGNPVACLSPASSASVMSDDGQNVEEFPDDEKVV